MFANRGFSRFWTEQFFFDFFKYSFFFPSPLSASLEFKHALQSLSERSAVALFLAVFYWAQLEAASDPVFG